MINFGERKLNLLKLTRVYLQFNKDVITWDDWSPQLTMVFVISICEGAEVLFRSKRK